jgi:hypothetical protein
LGRLRRRARGIYRWAVSFFASKTSSAVCGREDDGGGDDREGGKGDSGRPALALRCYIIGDARRVGRGRRGGTGGLGAPWTGTAEADRTVSLGPGAVRITRSSAALDGEGRTMHVPPADSGHVHRSAPQVVEMPVRITGKVPKIPLSIFLRKNTSSICRTS